MRRLFAITLGVALAGPALAASLMPQGKQEYSDNSGHPLSGGLLYTYSAGTSTPLATYSDQAGTIPNANPVVLNSRGEATIFWGAGPYKVTLRTSAGSLVWTQDNLYPPLTAGEPLKLYSGGNAATPELTWADDTNSGFYLAGEDDIGLSLGGTKRWEHTAAGQTESGGLDVAGATTVGGTFAAAGAATLGADLTVAGAATFNSTATVAGALTASGAFDAIGATSLSSTLTVAGAVTASNTIHVAGAATFDADASFASSVTVPTPLASTDAANKAYVDDTVGLVTTTLTAGTDWTLNTSRVVKSGNVVTVYLIDATAGGSSTWSSVATLPVGYRPGATGTGYHGVCNNVAPGTLVDCVFSITTGGVVIVSSGDSGTGSLGTIFEIGAGDTFNAVATFVSEN